jgi:hypothetical protein
MRGKRPGEGVRHREGQGARGVRAELGQAGSGWAAPRVKTPWHAQPRIEIQFAKQNPKRDETTHATKHDIRQKKYDST